MHGVDRPCMHEYNTRTVYHGYIHTYIHTHIHKNSDFLVITISVGLAQAHPNLISSDNNSTGTSLAITQLVQLASQETCYLIYSFTHNNSQQNMLE